MQIGLAEKVGGAHGIGQKDGVAAQRGGGIAPGGAIAVGNVAGLAGGKAASPGIGGDGAGDIGIVGGDDIALAVEDGDHSAPGQDGGPQHVVDPVHIQRDADGAVEAAVGLVKRQQRPDHIYWPVTRLRIWLDTTMPGALRARWNRSSMSETDRSLASGMAEQATRPSASMRLRLEK